MKIVSKRFANDGETTLSHVYIDGEFFSFNLEDGPQGGVKIPGKTRIPAGEYQIKVRRFGRWAERIRTAFDLDGSLEICNIPNFTDVLFHWGNKHEHTAGCFLLGFSAKAQQGSQWMVLESKNACEAFYRKVWDAAEAEELTMQILDEEDTQNGMV